MILSKSFFYIPFYELNYRVFGKKYIANIDITDKCNLRCKHCYHKEKLKEKENISLKDWEKRFEKYKKMGIRYVQIAGGEPSLRYDVLKLADKYFPFISVATNGQVKIPKEFNHRIFLSLDGFRSENDIVRGEGTFDRAIKNYKNDKRVLVWSILFTINYKGPEKLKEFINFIRKLGLQGIHFGFYLPVKGEDNSMFLSDSEKKEVKKVFLEEIKREDSILFLTRGVINNLLNPNKYFIENCNLRKKTYLFDTNGKPKKCFNSSFDCSRCGCPIAYWVPIYKPREWFSHYWMRYKLMLKIK